VDNPAEDLQQPYDTFVKALFRSEMESLVSYFLKGATLDGTLEEAEQNVEIDRSILKADLAYWIKYFLLQAILHIELQSGPDKTMARRMLAYFANLHLKYNVPVFCIVIFLFKCAVGQSPYRVSCGDKVILPEFHYDIIRLWEEDPRPILAQHRVPLYVLLPAMKDPTVDMLRQAIKEIHEYYNSERCGERLAQFHVVLSRTTTVPDNIKDMIGKELSMSTQYSEFMQQNPIFLEKLRQCEAESWKAGKAAGKAEGKAEGKIEGKTEGEIEMILQLLHTHFSEATAELAELSLRRVDIRDAEVIRPLKDATVKLDEQGVNTWMKDHLPPE
jgi:predicted transposase YdaD